MEAVVIVGLLAAFILTFLMGLQVGRIKTENDALQRVRHEHQERILYDPDDALRGTGQ